MIEGIGMTNLLLNQIHKAKTAPMENETPQAYAAPTTPIASNPNWPFTRAISKKTFITFTIRLMISGVITSPAALNAAPTINKIAKPGTKDSDICKYSTANFWLSSSSPKAPIISSPAIKNIKVEDNGMKSKFYEKVNALNYNDFNKYLVKTNLYIYKTFGDYSLNSFDKYNSPRLILILKKKSQSNKWLGFKEGGDILSHQLAVPSALLGLTTLFEMGRGEPQCNNHPKVSHKMSCYKVYNTIS